MKPAKSLVRSATVVGLSATFLIGLAAIAEAAVCRGRMSGEGSGIGVAGQGPALARSNALADWSRKVSARHGAGFATSTLAQSVRYDCRQGVLETKCVVTAVPCAPNPPRKPKRPRR